MNGRIIWVLLALVCLGIGAQAAYIEAGKIIDIKDDYSILPAEVYVGDTVSLAVNLYNKGLVNAAKDLTAELVLPVEFEPVDVETKLDSIRPGITQTVLFKFKVNEHAFPGTYSLNIRINYTGQNTTAETVQTDEVTDTKVVTIKVQKARKNIDMKVEPTVLFPGRKVEVKFTLGNASDNPLSNINLSWTEAQGLILPIGSDNRRYLNSIGPGEEGVMSFMVAVDPNITPGVYSFDTSISYNDESASTTTLESKIGFVVGGTTDFDVSLQETGNGQVSLSIANIGSNNAEGIVVRIPNQPSFSTQGFDTSVLGNLNRGDFTIATFRIVPTFQGGGTNGQATGTQPPADATQPVGLPGIQRRFRGAQGGAAEGAFADLLVEITYTDTTGERQTVQKTVHFMPQSLLNTAATGTDPAAAGGTGQGAQGRQGGTSGFLPLVVLLVVGGGGYLYWKKRAGAEKVKAKP